MRYFLFDLDGTLTDPALGITNAILYALEKMGRELPERQELYKFIGPPLLESFEKYCGMSEAEAKEALRLYRVYFSETGIFENSVYEGVPEMLGALKKRGAVICVATSKPEVFARRIIEHFGLSHYFDFVGGSSLDNTRTDKAEVISYVMNGFYMGRDETVMVGDRKHDIIGAKTNGIMSVGVLYGYGSREELEACGADRIACDVAEAEKMLCGLI